MSGTMPLWRVLELTEDPGTGRNIGLDAYPIFDEMERDGINRLIVDHFLLRDIGQETISMFTFMLRRTMREIMPVYNELYLSKKMLAGKELATYDLSTVRSGTASETMSGNTSGNSSNTGGAQSTNVNYSNPQVALSRNKDYAASAAEGTSSSTNSGTQSGTTSTNTAATTGDTSRTTGTQGSLADMLNRYRSTIINVDLMLLNDPELTSMFLGVWDSSDEIVAPRHRLTLGGY